MNVYVASVVVVVHAFQSDDSLRDTLRTLPPAIDLDLGSSISLWTQSDTNYP